jgi:hypothetical protein
MRVPLGLIAAVLGSLTGPAGLVPPPAPPPVPATSGPVVRSAAPGPATPSPTTVCTVRDPAVTELSGVAATADGYVVVDDSNLAPAAIRIFFLDRSCDLVRSVGYPTPARDPEDVAISPDGTIWVADIGDNLTNDAAHRRSTIALWRLPPGGRTPQIYRLTYPDGPHDAEALLLNGDGSPVIVTKEPLNPAGIYVPSGQLQPDTAAGVKLRRVGTFSPVLGDVPNPYGLAGELFVTGGANAPDGRRVVLRTYAAAYEWDVPNGDVVAAITTGQPRITELPNEPQGEGIAYTPDGRSYLTVCDETGSSDLRRYPVPVPVVATAVPSGPGGPSLVSRLITRSGVAGLIAVAGLLLALIGLFGILRARRGAEPG